MLSQEERNDLRRKVLRGEQLSLEDAKAVIASLREGRGVAAAVAEAKPKRTKKNAMSDEALQADLDSMLTD